MTHEKVEEKRIGQYLLGQLGDTEQRQLEERLMTQDDLFEQVQVLEDELIDEYLRNTLSAQDRADFEKHFVSAPERFKKLRFAQAFRSYVAVANEGREKEHSKSSLWQTLWTTLRAQSPTLSYGLPVAVLGAFLGCLWMAGTIQQLHTEVAQVRSEQGSFQDREQQLQQQLEAQRRRNVELEQQLVPTQAQSQKPPETSLSTLALVLTPGLVRDSGTSKRLTISPDTRPVALRLELGDHKYESYRVVLQDDEGSEILARNKVKPERSGSSQFLVLTLGAKDLPRGDYSLKVSGATQSGEFEPLVSYTFGIRTQ